MEANRIQSISARLQRALDHIGSQLAPALQAAYENLMTRYIPEVDSGEILIRCNVRNQQATDLSLLTIAMVAGDLDIFYRYAGMCNRPTLFGACNLADFLTLEGEGVVPEGMVAELLAGIDRDYIRDVLVPLVPENHPSREEFLRLV